MADMERIQRYLDAVNALSVEHGLCLALDGHHEEVVVMEVGQSPRRHGITVDQDKTGSWRVSPTPPKSKPLTPQELERMAHRDDDDPNEPD